MSTWFMSRGRAAAPRRRSGRSGCPRSCRRSRPAQARRWHVVLDLQAVLDTAYDRAGYDLEIDYSADPVPPLEPRVERLGASPAEGEGPAPG